MSSNEENGAHDWARHVIDRNDDRAARLEMASVEAGNLAIKAMFLVNGGA